MARWGRILFQDRRARSRRRRIARTMFLLLVCAGLVVGVWYGTRHVAVTITTVRVSGDVTIDAAMVEREVQSLLSGSYFLLVPKRFSYIYPKQTIVRRVMQMPRVAKVQVTRMSRTAISVALIEHTPVALWCASAEIEEDTSVPCFYVSEDGVAFAEAPSLTGAVFSRYVTPDRSPAVGASLAPRASMHATQRFTRALALAHGMGIDRITETSDRDVRYHVRGGGELLTSTNANMQEVFENLDAILTSEEFAHIKSGAFVYIDLRFGNKAFVKEFPDESQAEVGGADTVDQATTTETVE